VSVLRSGLRLSSLSIFLEEDEAIVEARGWPSSCM